MPAEFHVPAQIMPLRNTHPAGANQAKGEGLIPYAVISATVDGATPVRAWCEHLGLTQAEVATRMGFSQSAYAQQKIANGCASPASS